jgi:hypothetical protein
LDRSNLLHTDGFIAKRIRARPVVRTALKSEDIEGGSKIASNEPNTRARNGYFTEIASNEPNTRARNGYFAEISSNEPNTRARNGYFAEIASNPSNTRARNG